jgi:hypothetical protein
MPADEKTRGIVLNYCDRHLPSQDWFDGEFSFIEDAKLAKMLALEFYSARYIYKLGEAIDASDNKLHGHLKFQIMQYASIYEAIIVNLLFKKYKERDEVKAMLTHKAYKKIGALPVNIMLASHPSEPLAICVHTDEKTTEHAIKFDDKVAAAVSIGFLHVKLGEEIKEFYRLRNGMHLESAVKNNIEFEITQSTLAYRRMRPFIDGVKEFTKSGKKPTLT